MANIVGGLSHRCSQYAYVLAQCSVQRVQVLFYFFALSSVAVAEKRVQSNREPGPTV